MKTRLLVALLLLPASALAQASVVVQPPSIRVEIAPPAPIDEAPPPPPSPQHVWTRGYWTFTGGRYAWVPGTYVLPPQPASRWIPARWIARDGAWWFEDGHWVAATASPPPPPPRPAPPPRAPPVPAVVSARDIHAGTVRARVIYANEVRAVDGRVGAVLKLHGKPPKGEGDLELDQPEVVADTIYAKRIDARWVEAGEIHAKHVKIGR
jgi:WXXGXW repeat (2 copies)